VYKSQFDGSIDDYLKSDFLNNIKNQMINNQAPKDCLTCTQNEINNSHSFRLLHNNFRPDLMHLVADDPTQNYIENISIVTSNICNLKCLPCLNSSYVRTLELHKLNLIKYIPIVNHIHESIFDNLTNINFKKLTLLGGEPFYDRYCLDLLEKLVKTNKSKNIELDINTNCTKIDSTIVDFLSDNFKFVQIKASIDGVEKVNDYLRYPSDWETILKSLALLKKRDNLNLIVTTALSNLALIRYYEVIEWAVNFGIKDLFLTPVSDPIELAVTNLPINIKRSLEKKYLDLKENLLKNLNLTDRTLYCIDTAIESCRNSTDYDMTASLDWLLKHDNLRGTNCFDVFPELNDY
jgi:organic radical activating enzyme